MGLESPQHECAVIGIISPDKPVSQDLYYGLIAQQNRGQEGSGMAVFNPFGQLKLHKDLGLVNAVYDQNDIDGLFGYVGVGHNRYGTTGSHLVCNTQPFSFECDLGSFAFVTNGNVFNAQVVRKKLESEGAIFISSSDSEVIAALIACSPGRTFVDKIKVATQELQGAYSCLIATEDSLIGFRDPHGIWPLNYGRINGSGYAFASETNALEKLGVKEIEEVENGGIVTADFEKLNFDNLGQKPPSLCSFEFYYFSDPFSMHLGRRVEGARFDMGRQLALEHPFEADLVCCIPETSRSIAEGYAFQSKAPLRSVLIRNRWLGRTFIEPSQKLRDLAASYKYGILKEIVEGKIVNVVDDSIVRGTTTGKTINIFRDAGAKEVNVLIAAPPIKAPCWFGIDTASKEDLIAARITIPKIRDYIGADKLGYLSLEGGMRAIGEDISSRLCVSCFTGKYQMQVPGRRDKLILERK